MFPPLEMRASIEKTYRSKYQESELSKRIRALHSSLSSSDKRPRQANRDRNVSPSHQDDSSVEKSFKHQIPQQTSRTSTNKRKRDISEAVRSPGDLHADSEDPPCVSPAKRIRLVIQMIFTVHLITYFICRLLLDSTGYPNPPPCQSTIRSCPHLGLIFSRYRTNLSRKSNRRGLQSYFLRNLESGVSPTHKLPVSCTPNPVGILSAHQESTLSLIPSFRLWLRRFH